MAIAVGFGMILIVTPTFFRYMPDPLHPCSSQGSCNGVATVEEAGRSAAAMVAAAAEHP